MIVVELVMRPQTSQFFLDWGPITCDKCDYGAIFDENPRYWRQDEMKQ